MDELKPKTDLLFSYIFSRARYSLRIRRLLLIRDYNFVVVLLWQVFILFIYEKLSQIDDAEILKCWKEKFGKDKPPEYKSTNFFWPNTVSDDNLLTLISELYPMDKNYINQARACIKKRDAAAHVSDLEFTYNDVDHFLDELLRIMEKLHVCHQIYLDKLDKSLIDRI